MLRPLRLDVAPLELGSPSIIDSAMLKKHVRVDFDDDNELLDLYLQAGVNWCEGATHITIIQRTHTWILREFPDCFPYEIRLPRGKTISVENIQYSADGSITTLYGPTGDASPAGDDYQEDLRGDSGGVLMPPRGTSWPSTDRDVPAPVAINFTAGWAGDDVPADLIHAIMFCVADAYDLRGTADFDPAMLNTSGPRFAARAALVSGYSQPRVY